MSLSNFTIDAHHDFEFNINSRRSIDYSIYLPEGELQGLVVYIAGFGADAGAYQQNFLKHISDNYSMASLFVDYHCFFARPSNGANLSIDPHIMNLLRSITGCIHNESVDTVLIKLNEMRTGSKIPIQIPGTLYPKKNEYQNFGILPALDIIYAINDVFQKFSNIPKKIYAIGSSYGGYIANIVSKLAPCTLNAVFDNSSWASPNINYIVGRDLGSTEFTITHLPNLIIRFNVLSPWSHLTFMPNAFNNDRLTIRSFSKEHIGIMAEAGNRKTFYRFVHFENDGIADTKQKNSLAQNMSNKGFNVQIRIYSPKDIDGKYIKSADHGMGLSMKKFFSIYYNEIKDAINFDQRIDFDFKHSIQFPCESQNYIITYSGDSQPVCKLTNQI